jgi:hypothetical protein
VNFYGFKASGASSINVATSLSTEPPGLSLERGMQQVENGVLGGRHMSALLPTLSSALGVSDKLKNAARYA